MPGATPHLPIPLGEDQILFRPSLRRRQPRRRTEAMRGDRAMGVARDVPSAWARGLFWPVG
jgi:hypothetical protein